MSRLDDIAAVGNSRRRKSRRRLRIAGEPVLTATAGVPYDGFTVTATGGLEPHVFSNAGWPLPDGLTLDPGTGEVAGTPTTPGMYPNLILRVTDDILREDDLPAFTIEVS